ncbi:conjugal transfer protein [Mycolicibacterium nivoides]|uniref:Conjugal transfer protein n=1 Tax=Mycolicibacterium nivoides TaxID=2487344 RepID=A0ABW9LK64_9MYCO
MTGKLPTQRKQFDELTKPIDRQLLARRALNVLAAIGGVFAIISTVHSLWPEASHSDSVPGNSSVPSATLVTGFARDYVTAYLTAKAGDEQKLARYVTIKDVKLPPVAAEFTDADVAFVKQISTTDDGVAVWTVTVSGLVNGATVATPQRTFYRVPITVLDGAPRASALPMQVAAPNVGIDFRLGYRNDVTWDSPLGKTAAGFVRSYLTGGADFALYVTTDCTEKPIQPAPYAKVDILKIEANVAGDGSNADAAEVYVTVAARTKNYTLTQLAYPLTLRSVEGQWRVSELPKIPLMQTRVNSPREDNSTTTTSTTPPPPPTRG